MEAKKSYVDKARAANECCQKGDFDEAVRLYGESIKLNEDNHLLYSNRSAAYIRTKQFVEALEDGRRAATLKPDWPKVYDIQNLISNFY